MKRAATILAILVLAIEARGATVVLAGGKKLDVAGYSVSGSYVNVRYANGREEWYPLAAVDLAATKAAAGTTTAPAPAADAGPHSPFLGAKSSAKPGGVVVTDADVKHVDTEAPGEEAEKKDEEPLGGQVVLVGYDKKAAGPGQWEITATVSNQGKTAVQNVSAVMRVLDAKGKPMTVGSSSVLAKLDPGKQGTITARVGLDTEPPQVAVDLAWQEIRPTTKPTVPAAQRPGGQAALTAAPSAPNWSRPAGSSPNALPSNVMGVAPANTTGAAAQVSPPSN